MTRPNFHDLPLEDLLSLFGEYRLNANYISALSSKMDYTRRSPTPPPRETKI